MMEFGAEHEDARTSPMFFDKTFCNTFSFRSITSRRLDLDPRSCTVVEKVCRYVFSGIIATYTTDAISECG